MDNLVLDHYIQAKDFDKRSKSNLESLEGQLTLCEISEALTKLKNTKCPGTDGFPAEIFILLFFFGLT